MASAAPNLQKVVPERKNSARVAASLEEPEDEDLEENNNGPSVMASTMTLEQKWTQVRAQALSYLNARKIAYDALNQKKQERIRELALHLIFLVLFSWVALSARDTNEAHFLVKGLSDEITGAPIPDLFSESKDFTGVNNVDDFWDWLQKVFIPNLYGSDPNTNYTSILYMGTNYFVSPIVLRQVRVKNTICNNTLIPSNLRTKITNCFPAFSDSDEETDPNPDVFDPATSTFSKWPTTFSWSYVNHTGSAMIDSKFNKFYGNGGYKWKLGSTLQEALDGAAIAKSSNFISQAQTRAIFMEYVLYNPGSNLYVTCTLMYEVPPTAGFTYTASFRAVNLYRMGREFSLLGLIFEIIVFLFVLLFIAMEAMHIYTQRLAYFREGYNLITIVNIIFFVIVIVLEVVTLLQADAALKLSQADFENYDIKKLVYWTYQVYNWNAFNALLTWVKTLKYVDIVSKKSMQLSLTLSKAASSIAVLMLLFIILYCGFGIAFYMAFGQDVEDFRALDTALLSLFRAMLGDFDFASLRAANKVLGPILFIAFIILIFFCLLNMFMAVIMGAYEDVVDELARTPDELSSSIRKSARKLISKLFMSKRKITEQLREKGDRILTEAELQEIFDMEQEQFSRMGITNPRYLISIADTDLDGSVSLSEMQQLHMAVEEEEEGREELTPSQQLKILQEEQQSQRVLIAQLLNRIQSALGPSNPPAAAFATAKIS